MPEASAVTVALAAPVRFTVAPLPPVIVPEMLQVIAVAVKFAAVTLALLTVTGRLAGLSVKPLLVGVTVYEPLAKPVKL